MNYVIYLGLVLLGACMGSFAGATVWRIRARQLVADKKAGEKVAAKELKQLTPLTKTTLLTDRSHCLQCGYELRWYDLLPVISWISLKGKCRQCRKPIGWFELLIELGMALFFVGSFLLWPFELGTWLEITRFIIWLISGVVLGILFAYDAKWFLLPNVGTLILAILGLLTSGLVVASASDPLQAVISVIISVAILGGLYWVLHVVSRGRWVGFGDVKLGIGLGLLLADWRLALVALFAANVIGTLMVLPGMIRGKLTGQTRIPFGPLLIAGTILAQLVGLVIVDWYFVTLLL